ncbi:MAG TPA: hypothetical protein VNV82_16665 [Bryobacteraceae bacterium]|jgi:hypothetical protein|nr:hypothetical protein [Bryobacteraceae bacterium]
MIRKQIYIAPQQDKMLKRLARQTRKTEAEIIRDAIEEHARSLRDKQSRVQAWRAIEATIEQRMKLAAVEAGRSWKREDLYDRGRSTRFC